MPTNIIDFNEFDIVFFCFYNTFNIQKFYTQHYEQNIY